MDTRETDKRLHRCCFTGHRPEKIGIPERKIKQLLTCAVDKAIKDGYTTFITGMARGVDLWAGEIVLQRKKICTEIRLICATPYPGFEVGWKQVWRELYASVSKQADYRVAISSGYHRSPVPATTKTRSEKTGSFLCANRHLRGTFFNVSVRDLSVFCP